MDRAAAREPGTFVVADDEPHGGAHVRIGEEHAEHAEHASFEGKLVCLGCTLKGEGARAECSEYGHTHGLMVEDDDMIFFLPNKYSANLIDGGKFHNKMVAVSGVYYEDAHMLDVEMYKVGDQKYGWCDHCSAMDGCKFAKK